MRFRKAFYSDVFNIIQLYQKSRVSKDYDALFLDYRELESTIRDNEALWMLTEIDGAVVGAIFIRCDWDQRIAKISHMLIDPSIPENRSILRESLKHSLHYLEKASSIDVVYTTTLTVSMEQQNITLEEGFKVLGIFPNVSGEDQTKMNGLTAYYFNGVLEKNRSTNFAIHEQIKPFFEISQQQCQIPGLDISIKSQPSNDFNELPPLEMIRAEKFVRHRFKTLKECQSQIVDFYPFYTPDCMVTDPEESVQVYIARSIQKRGFAAIIGEHIETCINPVALYTEVQQILRNDGVSYIEIINEASDSHGVDCIIKAGFTPCAYFPAFKRLGKKRQDYVVFGKSFEYLCRPSNGLNHAYNEFYKEYFKIEGKNYFPGFV